MASETHPEVKLECSLQVSPNHKLALTYHVHNGLARDIFLFTPLTDYRDQEFVPIPQRVYVFIEGETVHITKRLWPVPDDVDVYVPEVPFLTRVAAGEGWEEHLDVPLPLSENYPYQFLTDPPASESTRSVRSGKHAVFSVGYLVFDPKEDVIPEQEGDFYTISYGIGVTSQRLVSGEPVDIGLDVQRVEGAGKN